MCSAIGAFILAAIAGNSINEHIAVLSSLAFCFVSSLVCARLDGGRAAPVITGGCLAAAVVALGALLAADHVPGDSNMSPWRIASLCTALAVGTAAGAIVGRRFRYAPSTAAQKLWLLATTLISGGVLTLLSPIAAADKVHALIPFTAMPIIAGALSQAIAPERMLRTTSAGSALYVLAVVACSIGAVLADRTVDAAIIALMWLWGMGALGAAIGAKLAKSPPPAEPSPLPHATIRREKPSLGR